MLDSNAEVLVCPNGEGLAPKPEAPNVGFATEGPGVDTKVLTGGAGARVGVGVDAGFAISNEGLTIPGYGPAFEFDTDHACNVPSLAYRYNIGDPASEDPSLGSEKSISSAIGTVSSASLSSGTLGVDVSSRLKLHQVSAPSLKILPTTPISLDVLSATNASSLAGSQFLTSAAKAPGGRMAGAG